MRFARGAAAESAIKAEMMSSLYILMVSRLSQIRSTFSFDACCDQWVCFRCFGWFQLTTLDVIRDLFELKMTLILAPFGHYILEKFSPYQEGEALCSYLGA